ncbi:MAG TPA: hypothetical protein EYG86_05000 [Crocinitomicaceae bacterium]|nr:hypothetical protein [Crocinitomicaceae bacterium]
MMRAQKTIEISSIQFESNDPDVLIKGKVKQGNLEYPTDLLVSQTQLNRIINKLKKINFSFDINQYLLIENMYNNECIYTANFTNSINTKLNLSDVLNLQTYVQIRA